MPPDTIEIVDHPAGSRVKIRENEEVELTCKVSNAKPKADIVWYRKDSQFVTGKTYFRSNLCKKQLSNSEWYQSGGSDYKYHIRYQI